MIMLLRAMPILLFSKMPPFSLIPLFAASLRYIFAPFFAEAMPLRRFHDAAPPTI